MLSEKDLQEILKGLPPETREAIEKARVGLPSHPEAPKADASMEIKFLKNGGV